MRTPAVPPLLLLLVLLLPQACSAPGPAADPQLDRLRTHQYPVSSMSDSSIHTRFGGSPEDPRVIYIHGTPGDASNFTRYLVEPVPGLEAVAIDRPGFGKSLPRRAVPRLADQAAAIEPLLVERNGRWPLLVGHSLGGPIVARVAADHPDRVSGIVILAGALDPALERVQVIQHLGNFAFVPYLLPRWARNANRELIPLRAELEALDPLLADVTCPVVVIHGTRDRLVPYANVEFMRRKLAHTDLEIVTLDGGGHFLPWRHEAAVRAAVGDLRDRS